MKIDELGEVVVDGKPMRCGFTTGTCAAAVAKAGVMSLKGKTIDYVIIETPAGKTLRLPIEVHELEQDHALCSIVKDSGDDPDVTNGTAIFARVSPREDKQIHIMGGKGVGRITRKAIFGEVGEPAINKVPRQMIQQSIREVSEDGYDVEIIVPEGEELAKKTFNPNIGIEGGISIIGTTGIIKPMSEESLIATIYLEIDHIFNEKGPCPILLVLGNHGENMAKSLGIHLPTVTISNFIGKSLQYAYHKGFRDITLLGHVGKLCKVSIGAFHTHSKVCDTRMEAFVYHLAMMGVDLSYLETINQSLTAEQALLTCIEDGYGQIANRMQEAAERRIRTYLKDPDLSIKVLIYTMKKGVTFC